MSLSFRHHPTIRALHLPIPPRLPLALYLLPVLCVAVIAPGRAAASERIKSAATAPDAAGTPPLLAGSLVRSPAATTTWFLYPGACAERAAGTWTPRSSPQADSLNSYTAGTSGAYTIEDQTLRETLWHVSDNATCTAGTTCPAALSGSRMLWCGKYDAGWVMKYGYPSFTYQILYIDTGTTKVISSSTTTASATVTSAALFGPVFVGMAVSGPGIPTGTTVAGKTSASSITISQAATVTGTNGLTYDGGHAGPTYNLNLSYQFSSEFNYDHVWLIGGGGGLVDPIGNSRAQLDAVIAAGGYLIHWTGSIRPTSPNATGGSTVGGPLFVSDNPGSPSTVVGASYTIDGSNRALYLVFESDCFNSPEDGLWPEGHGQMLDDIATSDNGAIYTDQAAAGGVDAFNGNVLVGTSGAPIISARVAPGVGALWQLIAGSNLPTPDYCLPKSSSSDLIFEGGNGTTFHTIPGEATSIVSCTFPIPAGTASVVAQWSEYLDLPAYSGYVQFSEYRCFREGFWSGWRNTEGGGTRRVESVRAWGSVRSELAEAAQADSVQLRYSIRCVPELSADNYNCADLLYGLLYDDLRLEVVTGAAAPKFGIYPAFLAQSTFVDGTMGGVGCNAGTAAAGQCWPGVRGSDGGGAAAVHDNFNSPLGDSIVVSITSGLRGNGKGINWRHGFDRSVSAGLTIAHTNPNFVAAFDEPRVIFRLFDPATKTWSPFDSSELDANSVAVNAGDTVLIDSRFRMNWPPRDRVGASLPGGFSINGKTLYGQLAFLPRGVRLQYYVKAVAINGATVYQFSSDTRAFEVDDLPTLPGGSLVAPDIIEFDVLPGVYPAGPAGTLLAGRTNTPILNLDGAYTAWSYSMDPVTQALRALGVRADRYRLLQGTEQGGNVGGHELAGARAGRLANYFPNADEYAIRDSLAAWYRIMIESTHKRGTFGVLEDADAKLVKQWWDAPTGTDGGDRCLLSTGNDTFNALSAVGVVGHPNENALGSQVFGVAGAADEWNGSASNHLPLIKDMFADPAAGPGLGASGAYTYQIDGGCPGPDRFDALTKIGSAEAQNAATYPTFASLTNVAAVSTMSERDVVNDHDRNKALGYGYSIQCIRQGGENLVDTRAQILYKFLTSCRGPRAAADTASCWPCPTDANKYSNWLTASGFQTGTYGPLYAIQDATRVLTAVDVTPPPSFVDALLQNRPNPFNPETVIPYSLATPGRVAVRVYDVRGRLVRTLVDAIQSAGIHVARWNGVVQSGKRSASGIYFYMITYPDGHKSSKKMTILR